MSSKEAKPKRTPTQKQLDTLAKGRAKRAENLTNGITEFKPGVKNTADYLTGLVHGIEMDKKIVRLEDKPYNNVLDRLDGDFGVDVIKISDPKVKPYVKKVLTQKKFNALTKCREKRAENVAKRKQK